MAISKKSQTSRIAVWIILILLVLGLIGFGAGGFSGTIRSIGKVGDTSIDLNRYARELDQELRALQAQTGESMTLSQAQAFGVDRAVVQRLVGAAALENETARLGLSVGDAQVHRQVIGTPAFSGVDGKFDRDSYEFALERSGLTPAEFEDSVRSDVAKTILQSAVSGGVAASSTFSDALLDYIGERRNFTWIEMNRSTLDEPLGEPSDAELRAYYDENIDDFMLPEVKKFTYAWLSPDLIADEVQIDDDTLRALYEDRASEYNIPERRLLERLIFATADEAAAALAEITAGTATFGDVVVARGLTLGDIDLGDISRADLGDAGDAVFALDGPGLVGPLETNLGPAIFRVNAVLSARATSFEDARDDLHAELAADAARREIDDQIGEIDDLLAGGATLEDLALETKMQIARTDWTLGNTDGIAAYEAFGAAAQIAAEQDFPEVIELDDGGIFALRLDTVVAPRAEPFDAAVVKVIQAWETSEIAKRLNAQAEALIAQLENDVRIGSLGMVSTVETHITRSDFIAGASPAFIEAVFAMQLGESRAVVQTDNVLIAQLNDILPADESDPTAVTLRAQLQDGVAQAIAQDLLDAFTRSIETQAGITLDQNAINAVHAQFP